ncbi:MAG: acetylaminoadipate kinase [Thermoplasmatota archaeon]
MSVIKLGGAVCLQDEVLDEVARTWHDHGNLTLVHGAGPQLDDALQRLGPTIRLRGLRVTSPQAAAAARRVLDDVGSQMAKALRRRGVPAIHVPASLRLFNAICRPDPGLGRVGHQVQFDAAAMRRVVGPDAVAVVTPVAWDDIGPLNINADEGAAALAQGIGAERLVLATDVAHVHDEAGEPIARMDVATARAFLASPAAQGGIIPKVEAALAVLDAGVPEVRIGSVACAAGIGGTCFIPG